MRQVPGRIGVRDDSFELLTVRDLVAQEVIDPPLDGNHWGTHPKGDDFIAHGVPFIVASDVKHGLIDYTACKFISAKQASTLRKGFARQGDVLLTHKATIGRTAIVESDEYPFVMLTPQVTYYRVRNRHRLNNRYLRFYFESEFFQKTLHLWADSGATRAYLGITAQYALPVILPPIGKQRKIAAILSAYDELIDNSTLRIALLEKLAEEIYREWFVRLRFPGCQRTKLMRGVPEGWTVEPLGKLLSDIIDYRGVTPGKLNSRWETDGIIALSALNVKGGALVRLDDAKRVSETLYDRWMRKKLQKFDILLTSEAPLGQVHMLMESERFVLSQRLFGLRAKDEGMAPYLYHYLLFPVGQGQLAARATGSTVGGIRQQLLRKVEIIVPVEDVLRSYTAIVLPILEFIHRLSKQNDLLVRSRNLLLPRLLSGKLSVENLDIQFPPGMKGEAATEPAMVAGFTAAADAGMVSP